MTDVSYSADADARSGLRHDRVQVSMLVEALRNWRRLIPNATELGLANALWYNTDRFCHKVSIPVRVIRYALVAQPVRDRPLLPGHRGAAIAVREVSAREPALLDMDVTPAALAFRGEQGAICLAAFAEGVMIGCLWFCLGPYQEDEVRCLFTPAPTGQTAWDFGAYVVPAYRSSVVFLRLWDEANAYLRERGIRWSLSRISSYNLASLRSHQSLGAVVVGTATFVCCGPWQAMWSPLEPRFHLSTNLGNSPQLTVHAPAVA